MPIDAGIYANLLRGPKSVEEYDNEAIAARGNALQLQQQRMQMNALQRQQEEDNLYKSTARGFGSDTQANYNSLIRAGLVPQAQAYQKSSIEARDKTAEVRRKESDLIDARLKQSASLLSEVHTPEQYLAWHEGNHTDPVIGPLLASRGITADQARANIVQALKQPGGLELLVQRSAMGLDAFYKKLQEDQKIAETVRHNTKSEGIMERNNIRSNERMIGNGGGGGVAMSKPFELTGEDGQQVVVQQDKQGNIRPVQGFSPKPAAPNAAQQKELMSINQQRSIVNGALNAVTSTPGAFTFMRGVAGKLPFGETLAGRTETPQETQARAYVFNNVSRVINERAGAAQSAQELARLNSFLPADTDGPEQIKNKLNGFITYLNDLESGTRGKPTQAGGAPQMPTKPAGGAKFLGYE